jgi:hypothetical protein
MTIFFALVLFVCLVWFLLMCLTGLGATLFLPSAPPKRPPERLDPNRWDQQHYEAYIKRAFGACDYRGPTGGKRLHQGYE